MNRILFNYKIDILSSSRILPLLAATCLTLSCRAPQSEDTTDAPEDATASEGDTAITAHPEGWTDETHGKEADADYDKVFAEGEVKRLDITISGTDWQAMLDDVQSNSSGVLDVDGDMGDMLGQDAIPDGGGLFPGFPPDGGDFQDVGFPPDGGEMGDRLLGSEENPIWVPCTVSFEGLSWWYVGTRFKGFSSLQTALTQGSYKLPFKLDFDQFEEEYPQITDQRFYGFKRLSLANNAMDSSYLRDKVAGDLFREGGITAPRRTFVRLFIDHGEGPVYFGLYTMAEIPDSPMLESQFGEKGGNLYKPDGQAATWQQGYAVDESSFTKKTNEADADWSDVTRTIEALHASREDPAVWRANLEKVFAPYVFLRWLAINTVIQDWDQYGNMSHNYYLYGVPAENGRLHWIPWDHNLSFQDSGLKETMEEQQIGLMGKALPLDMSTVSNEWPLIRFLYDDPVYREAYWTYVQEFLNGVFAEESVTSRLQAEHDLIAPYVIGAEGEQPQYTMLSSPSDFETSLDELFTHVKSRHLAVAEALNSMNSTSK